MQISMQASATCVMPTICAGALDRQSDALGLAAHMQIPRILSAFPSGNPETSTQEWPAFASRTPWSDCSVQTRNIRPPCVVSVAASTTFHEDFVTSAALPATKTQSPMIPSSPKIGLPNSPIPNNPEFFRGLWGPLFGEGSAGRPWPAGDHRFDSCRAATALIFSAVDPSTGPLSIPISAHFLAHEHLGPVAFPAIAESEIDRGAQDG